MISHPVPIIIALVAMESLVLFLSRHEKTRRLFDLLPAVFWIYFIPMLAANLGIITSSSPVYGAITTWVLPASLVLLLLPVDMLAILRLGPKALAMFFIGAIGIMAGTAISFSLFKPLVGGDYWSGFGALSASWTGGSANMIATKEALSVPDSLFAPMVIVDTVVPYLWMGILIAMVRLQPTFDRRFRADRAILESMGERAAMRPTTATGKRTAAGIVICLLVAFAGSAAANLIGRQLPLVKDVVTGYTWTIMIVTFIGIALSFSPLRRLESSGAGRTGYDLLYFVLTAIGARASITDIGSAIALIAAGILIVVCHAAILLIGARLLKAPMFLVATASQANIGGAASAPVVAEIYHPGLASVGLLLAILGNIVGTWLGILCGQVCRII